MGNDFIAVGCLMAPWICSSLPVPIGWSRADPHFIKSCSTMDTSCLSSMNITGASQARSFAGQLPPQRCFASSHYTSFAVKKLVSRNKGRRSHRRHPALQVQPFVFHSFRVLTVLLVKSYLITFSAGCLQGFSKTSTRKHNKLFGSWTTLFIFLETENAPVSRCRSWLLVQVWHNSRSSSYH